MAEIYADIYEALEYVRRTDLEWAPKMVERQRQQDATKQAEAAQRYLADPMLMARLVPGPQTAETAEQSATEAENTADPYWRGVRTGILLTVGTVLLILAALWRLV